MKLAEALSLRADLDTRIAQLRKRLQANAKIQEGDEITEKMDDLYAELDASIGQYEQLIYCINHTNMLTKTPEGVTITKLIAQKDSLRLKANILRELLTNLLQSETRYGRSELKTIRIADPVSLRKEVDQTSKALRELDLRIQELNWNTELIEA